MQKTKIQWAHNTHNHWMGCTQVSPACDNCYAITATPVRVFKVEWGEGKERRLTSEQNRRKPISWNKTAAKAGIRLRVFGGSLNDWLDNEVPIAWLVDYLCLIMRTPNLDWLLLSKRVEGWRSRLEQSLDWVKQHEDTAASEASLCKDPSEVAGFIQDWLDGRPPKNVGVGATVEDQERADKRLSALNKIPAVLRFLSCEPMLSRLDLERYLKDGGIHWAIVGGESGICARDFVVTDALDLLKQCRKYDVAFFMKQLGSRPVGLTEEQSRFILDKKHGGNLRDFPEELRVREIPVPKLS